MYVLFFELWCRYVHSVVLLFPITLKYCICYPILPDISFPFFGKLTRYGLLRGTLRAPAVGWMVYNMLVSNEKAIESQYKSHVYANPENVTRGIVESRYALTKREGARYAPAAFLTGLLDPVQSREEFLELFAAMEGKAPVVVVSSKGSPKRSKAEMEALRGAKGVSKFVEVPGALLPQEEYPILVAEELYQFLQENFESKS